MNEIKGENRITEYLAKEIVEAYFDFGVFNLQNEKPDLQNEADNIGIEVTEAADKQTKRCRAIINSLFSTKCVKTSDEKCMMLFRLIEEYNTKEENHVEIKMYDGRPYVISKCKTNGQQIKIYEDLIFDRYDIKMKKLQNYKIFKTNGLFVFTEMVLTEKLKYYYKVFSKKNKLYRKNNLKVFDFVIMYSFTNKRMFYIDLNDFKKSYIIKDVKTK